MENREEKLQRVRQAWLTDTDNNDIPDSLEDGTFFQVIGSNTPKESNAATKLLQKIFVRWGKRNIRVSEAKKQLQRIQEITERIESAEKTDISVPRGSPISPVASVEADRGGAVPPGRAGDWIRIFIILDLIIFGIIYYFFIR